MSEVPAYTHWTGKPVTPGTHHCVTVPMSIHDGWAAFCSCGDWRTFVSFYDKPSKAELLSELDRRCAEHTGDKT